MRPPCCVGAFMLPSSTQYLAAEALEGVGMGASSL